MKYYLGIDVGGTDIKAGRVDAFGVVDQTTKRETPSSQEALIELLVTLYESYDAVEGIGLSMPGIIHNGVMKTSGALRYINTATFVNDLRAKLPVRFTLVNDANAVALAEKWCGNAIDSQDFVCITLGTAVGCALYLNDKLYEGAQGLAGELSTVMNYGVDAFSLNESVAGQCGVVAGACRAYSMESGIKTRDFREILKREADGEDLAKRVVHEFIRNNGVMLFNLAATLGVERILVGGSISNNETVMNRIKQSYYDVSAAIGAFPQDLLPKILTTKHQANSGIIGSVYALVF